jgi:uncharacterized protein (TIGR02145 family)/uncharacterized repeat protein (TIGR02059 family)
MSKKTVFLIFLLTVCFIISTCERKFEKVMEVSTGTSTDITSNSATVGGQIIDLGEGVTQHGHCYAKTPTPTVAGLKTQLGVPVVTGDFTSNLKDLEPGTKYYVRAYLNDGKEPVYGKETSFYTVSASPPIVTTTAATSVTNTTATLNGTVNANNLSTTVTFEYGLTISYGSTANATPNLVTGDSSTNVSASLTGLSEGTLYHYAVKAVSTGGTVYGIDSTFTTNINPIPMYVSSVIQNATPTILEMTYNTTLANIVPATSAFTVMVNSVSRTVNSIAISGTEVLLTLSSAVVYGDIVTVSYTKPASNPLQTSSGGQAASISAQAVTNNVTPVIVIPVYVSSAVQNAIPNILEMTYNSTLANIVPATSVFTIMVNSVSRTVNTVAISGTKVMLTLSSAVVYGDIITVSYTKPASNPLQTTSGGQAASISAQSVTNNVLPVIPVYVSSAVQNVTPSVLEMTYNLTLANIVPATSSFTVQVNSVSRTVNTATISGTKVMLTLASAVVFGDIVTVAYTKPASNPLQTASGGQAASISAQSVTNNTLCTAPSAITNSATSLTNTSATLNGTVNANGCSTLVTFDYGLTDSYGSTVTAVQSPVGGTSLINVSVDITGLVSGDAYHFRVKAVSTGGTSYGGDLYFITTVRDLDGNYYGGIAIGTQEWMLPNLQTTKYNDGTSIPNVTDNATWESISTGAYCWYNNDAGTYKATYGALYNWYTINTGKLCPAGWHMPTDADWTTLTDYLGGTSLAGGILKEAGTAHWSSPNTGATNGVGFIALPGGYRSDIFREITISGNWWSSTVQDYGAWSRSMYNNNTDVGYGDNVYYFGFSVRCLRDGGPF